MCNLCNASVDAVIRRDKRRVFRFGSLQGETAHRLVPEFASEAGLSTVVLLDGSTRYERSEAVLQVLKRLGGVYRLLAFLGRLVPRRWRDAWYRRVAATRYQKYGRRETCRLPTPEERDLFLP